MGQNIAFRIVICGRVQGVGFRYAAFKIASSLGLRGYIRNAPDGKVQGEVEGSSEAIQQFVAWCHDGPQLARVDEVIISEQPLKDYNDFKVR